MPRAPLRDAQRMWCGAPAQPAHTALLTRGRTTDATPDDACRMLAWSAACASRSAVSVAVVSRSMLDNRRTSPSSAITRSPAPPPINQSKFNQCQRSYRQQKPCEHAYLRGLRFRVLPRAHGATQRRPARTTLHTPSVSIHSPPRQSRRAPPPQAAPVHSQSRLCGHAHPPMRFRAPSCTEPVPRATQSARLTKRTPHSIASPTSLSS